MPSPVAHTFAAYAVMVSVDPSLTSTREKNSMALGTAFVLGSLADADFVVAHYTTATYLHHHYFSHSIPFALAFTLLCWLILKMARKARAGRLAGLFGAAYGSHLLLDYLTEDGSYPYGIPLAWPFSDTHFVAPVNIFYSIHRGTWQAIFGPDNMQALIVEVVVLLPVAILAYLVARRRAAGAGRAPTSIGMKGRRL